LQKDTAETGEKAWRRWGKNLNKEPRKEIDGESGGWGGKKKKYFRIKNQRTVSTY